MHKDRNTDAPLRTTCLNLLVLTSGKMHHHRPEAVSVRRPCQALPVPGMSIEYRILHRVRSIQFDTVLRAPYYVLRTANRVSVRVCTKYVRIKLTGLLERPMTTRTNDLLTGTLRAEGRG
jgi:hypothetical protein